MPLGSSLVAPPESSGCIIGLTARDVVDPNSKHGPFEHHHLWPSSPVDGGSQGHLSKIGVGTPLSWKPPALTWTQKSVMNHDSV